MDLRVLYPKCLLAGNVASREIMATWLGSFKPHVAEIAVQVCLAGMNIITRVALDEGMSHFVFVAYTLAVATVVISPFAFFLERYLIVFH